MTRSVGWEGRAASPLTQPRDGYSADYDTTRESHGDAQEQTRNRNGHWSTETLRFRLGRQGKERTGWTLRRGNQSGTIDFPPPGARL